MNALVVTTCLICITFIAAATALAAPPGQTPDGEIYIVQAEDWLSKIALKYYGDATAYPIIVEATNTRAGDDASFGPITNPDVIEVGQKLWIPARDPGIVSSITPAQRQNILTPLAELNIIGAATLAFSPDDQLLAIGQYQGIQVWDTQTWQLRWQAVLTDIAKVAFSPDGRRVSAVGFDNTAWLWDAASGSLISQLTYQHWVWGLDFSSDSHLWATGSHDGKITLADADSGQPLKEFNPGWVQDLALSPNGPWLAMMQSGSWGPGRVIVWDIVTEEQRLLTEFRLWAYSNVAFSPDGHWLAAGLAGDERAVGIWQTQTWPEVARLDVEGSIIEQVAFSPDGRWLAGVAPHVDEFKAQIWLWEVPTWRLVSKIELADSAGGIAFSPDGRWLAVSLGHETVSGGQLWEVTSGTLTAQLPDSGQVVTAAFSHDGQRLVTIGSKVKVWEFGRGK